MKLSSTYQLGWDEKGGGSQKMLLLYGEFYNQHVSYRLFSKARFFACSSSNSLYNCSNFSSFSWSFNLACLASSAFLFLVSVAFWFLAFFSASDKDGGSFLLLSSTFLVFGGDVAFLVADLPSCFRQTRFVDPQSAQSRSLALPSQQSGSLSTRLWSREPPRLQESPTPSLEV